MFDSKLQGRGEEQEDQEEQETFFLRLVLTFNLLTFCTRHLKSWRVRTLHLTWLV